MTDPEHQTANPEAPPEEFAANPDTDGEPPAKSGGGVWWKIIIAILLIGVVGACSYACVACGEPSEEEKAEERRKGFHCLSSYDGSHWDLKHEVQQKLNDPDSFEHVETRITPVDEDGAHYLFMEFRGRNAFGALVLSTATALVANDDCTALLISVE